MSEETITTNDAQQPLPGVTGGDDRIKAIEAEAAKLRAANEKLAADAQKRAEAEKKASEKKRIEEGELKSVLTEREKELERLVAERDALLQVTKARVDSIFDKLPDTSKAKVEKFRDKLNFADWAELVDAEAATVTFEEPMAKPTPPPTGSPKAPTGKNGARYEPTARAAEILETMMTGTEMLSRLKVAKSVDEESGARVHKFSLPVKEFFDRMTKNEPKEVSLTNATARGE